ncbi:hypothetical protein [Amycolatopsis sp. CA-230715]|uniref:hypothetical protein n=1 Tax=Amycolatopsis sp. CA-230715 TaxID=2745196 RepID=UPI001C01CC93|nr:hypothetical protein [Amycolatopsis sp. CA-230715]QWF85672.1 hypothetical protein HUW46_09127 [Amycolatopsis sp. CA-230715]
MNTEHQPDEQQTRYGSRFARMFGFVTDDDRAGWEQRRAQNLPKVGAAKLAAKSLAGSMLELGDVIARAKLDAAHRVAAQRVFDEDHDKVVGRRRDPRTRSIIETVDYERKDHRPEIEPDLEP